MFYGIISMKKVLFFCMLVTLLVACSKPSERSVFKYTTISNSKIEFNEKRLGDDIRLVSNRYDKNEQCFIAVFEHVFDQKIDAVYTDMFAYCTDLKSVVIPSGIKTIYSASFEGCSGLESITIPESVTDIKAFAFNECDLYISDLSAWCKIDHSSTVYHHLGDDDTVYMSDNTQQSYRLFLNGELLTELVIPDDVTEIKYSAFYGCTGLTSVTIPNSVTNIGARAFEDCTSLTSIEIPNSVTSIGNSAFYGTAWFQNQPDGVVYAGNVLYGYRGGMPENTSITIADGTLGIAAGAFRGCDGLTSVTIPNSVTNIGEGAFWKCSGLTSIGIPNSVTSIGGYAFEGCDGLTSIEIPNSVISIGEGAFWKCSGLTSIVIGNSVTNIGERAFDYCTGLESIKVESGKTVYDSRENCNAIIETETNCMFVYCKNTVVPFSIKHIISCSNCKFTDLQNLQ